MQIRLATRDDAAGMSRVLQEIIRLTGRERPNDTAFVTAHYITDATSIRCSVAVDDAGEILGFQSLKRAAMGNRFEVPEGWGIIGTHISPRAHRQGVGTALFASSKAAAIEAGLTRIDASIGSDNPTGLGYYEAMGFRTYREPQGLTQKVFAIEGDLRLR